MSYVVIILLLETLLLAVFLVLDIFLFYIFFESTLIPLFLLIGLFGSDNKVRASLYLFLYTLLGSLFLLLAILTISSIMGTTDFDALYKSNLNPSTQTILFAAMLFAFAVKTPVIFLHNWLLKAHVESPLSGSIILAAIVLKLSLYGICRLVLPILPVASLNYTPLVYLICAITIVYASLSTLRTIDVKELIAYSSVSHAAVYLLGIFSNTIQGIEGAILLGIGHGFVSSGLFICVGGVLYDRTHTRLITYYRGVAQIMPLFSLLFFILCLGNSGVPLTLNFIGEFLSLYGAFERLPVLGILSASSIVFSAAFTFFMYNRIVFGGSLSSYFAYNISDLSKREFVILGIFVAFTIFFGVYPAPILDGLHYSVSTLIYSTDPSGWVDNLQPLPVAMLYAIPLELINNSNKKNLDPNWVTGFFDAESCVSIRIEKYPKYNTGYRVQLRFQITLHKKDLPLLNSIKAFFGVGGIYKISKDSIMYQVTTINELQVIIDHFCNYPLITEKRADYELFKQAVELVSRKEHLTLSGLSRLVAIKASINRGLSPELKESFPNVIAVERPLVKDKKVKDPNWLAGFVSGDGCFYVKISKASTTIGYSVELRFQVTQHSRDAELLKSLVSYLNCGNCYLPSNYNFADFIVRKTSDILNNIIPFFNKYPIQGVKADDYADFCKLSLRKTKVI